MDVQAISAAVAATAAVVAATSGSITLKRTRDDSRNRNRPMVVAELRDVPHGFRSQILVVRNCGPTVARHVRVTFDPEIPDPDDASSSTTPFLKRRYADAIPVLVPGVELDNIWYDGDAGGKNREPCPDRCVVRISYDAPDGRRYEDDYPIDVGLIRERTYVTSSDQPEAVAKEAMKAQKRSADALTAMQRDLRSNLPRPQPRRIDRLLDRRWR